jgi:uncharacterized membrane protein (UPF0127 family)
MTRRATGGRWTSATAASLALITVLAAGCSDGSPTTTPVTPVPATPDTDTDPAPVGEGVLPEGFTTVQARITAADGEVCEVCLWLADDDTERARGLMGVTDLGDAAGMVFRYDEERNGSFYMFQTPTPLSIAWFADDGSHVGSAEMEPCLDTKAGDCPRYSPDAEYTVAIEVFAGGLEPLGIGRGASVELIDGSESDRCPVVSATP